MTCFCFCSETVYGQADSIRADTVFPAQDSIAETDTAVLDQTDFPVTDSAAASEHLRRVPDSRVKAYQRDPDFAYANDPAYWKELPPPHSRLGEKFFRFLFSRGFRIGLFILFLLLAGYGLYRLSKENSFTWFRRSSRPDHTAGPAGAAEDPEETDLDEAIRKNREAGNYKLAIRYMYLKIIRAAFSKGAILIKASSTNSDITRAFRDPQQARDFRYLATAYEHVFYGEFMPDREQFDLLEKKFDLFNQNLEN
ncbi:MAG TPA: DUF4129 domain-containing protein [Puia sp.]